MEFVYGSPAPRAVCILRECTGFRDAAGSDGGSCGCSAFPKYEPISRWRKSMVRDGTKFASDLSKGDFRWISCSA